MNFKCLISKYILLFLYLHGRKYRCSWPTFSSPQKPLWYFLHSRRHVCHVICLWQQSTDCELHESIIYPILKPGRQSVSACVKAQNLDSSETSFLQALFAVSTRMSVLLFPSSFFFLSYSSQLLKKKKNPSFYPRSTFDFFVWETYFS